MIDRVDRLGCGFHEISGRGNNRDQATNALANAAGRLDRIIPRLRPGLFGQPLHECSDRDRGSHEAVRQRRRGRRPGPEVPRGSLYGFIGPNGSGKTTTLRMIMHILLPDQGEIEVLGAARHPGGARPGQLPARGARAVQADERAAAAPLLRLAQGGTPARARPVDRPSGSSGWASRTGSTRRSTPCPRAWPRRSSSSPRCSTGPSC